MIKSTYLTLLIILTSFASVSAQSQDQVRQRRRAFFEDLLRVVVESQQDRNIAPPRPGRPDFGPPELRPGYGQGYGPVTTEMARCRKQLQVWEDECGRLIVELRKEERRLPTLRPLLADAMRIVASIANIRRYAARIPQIQPLVDPYCEIDADWRMLHHRLKQTRRLPQPCLQCLNKCNRCNTELCSLFEIQPQINRRSLSHYCTELCGHLQHLTQDVYYDMQNEPGGRKLVRECQALYARANEAVPLIGNGNYQTIVDIFGDCQSRWQKLKLRLLDCRHERVRRHCHHIETCGNHIRELLWLPTEIDYSYMGKICGRLQRDMEYIFSNYTLKDLLATPQPGILLNCCRDFQKQCGAFNTCITNQSNYDVMLQEYGLFANQWKTLRPLLAKCESPKILRRLDECDEHITIFNGVFGTGPVIDHYSMVEICAELDQYCLQLDKLIQQRIGRQYDYRFHEEICGYAAQFRNSVHILHEHSISSRRHEGHAQADLRNAMVQWKKLRPMIAKCKDADRRAFNQLRSRIEPLLVKLQVVYLDAG